MVRIFKHLSIYISMQLGAWRRIAHRAGVATAVEPAMERLRAQGALYAALEYAPQNVPIFGG
jgi:hypothetical protein